MLCGHIHPRQVVSLGAAQVVHPGATHRTSTGEGSPPKSVVRFHLGRQVTWRYSELKPPPAHLPPTLKTLSRDRQLCLL